MKGFTLSRCGRVLCHLLASELVLETILEAQPNFSLRVILFPANTFLRCLMRSWNDFSLLQSLCGMAGGVFLLRGQPRLGYAISKHWYITSAYLRFTMPYQPHGIDVVMVLGLTQSFLTFYPNYLSRTSATGKNLTYTFPGCFMYFHKAVSACQAPPLELWSTRLLSIPTWRHGRWHVCINALDTLMTWIH